MNAELERVKAIPDYKKELVKLIAEKIKNSKTVLIASIKGLPASKFQIIKKKLRGKAEVFVVKKSTIMRAISEAGKGSLQNLKSLIGSDVALMFSDIDAFELAGLLVDNQTSAKAKEGDLAPEDIEVEAGQTDLMPGPAISELGAVGLKVAVEGGKLAIKNNAIIVKKGEIISSKVVGVLGKLKIMPMKVGFIPVAAYDSTAEKIYEEIKIDKKGALENLRIGISKALGFAVSVGYVCDGTISYFIAKAGLEEKALKKIVEGKNVQENREDKNE